MISSETVQFIAANADADVRRLALQKHPAGVDIKTALTQIAGRQAAARKIPSWAAVSGLLYPVHLSMEQCTSEVLARYKAQIVRSLVASGSGGSFRFADLTGGFGVDCVFLSDGAVKTFYNEMDPELCSIAGSNFPLLGRPDIQVSCGSAGEFLSRVGVDSLDLIYIDPARRDGCGHKLVSIKDCSPDASALQERMLEVARFVLIKLSPMLDISRVLQELRHVRSITAISVAGECKELLVLLERGYGSGIDRENSSGIGSGSKNSFGIGLGNDVLIQAVNLSADGVPGELLSSTQASDSMLGLPLADSEMLSVGSYLYEPYAAQMKSGLYRTLCHRYGVCQISADSHLYVSKEPVPDFPGRTFRITEIVPFDKRSAKAFFQRHPQANIAVRNFPLTPDELRARFKVREGGTDYIFATTAATTRLLISAAKVRILRE